VPRTVEESLRVLPPQNAREPSLGVRRPPDVVNPLVDGMAGGRAHGRRFVSGELPDLRDRSLGFDPRCKTHTHNTQHMTGPGRLGYRPRGFKATTQHEAN
jgi:hypothetical protein